MVRQEAHNLPIAGSIPAPATKTRKENIMDFFAAMRLLANLGPAIQGIIGLANTVSTAHMAAGNAPLSNEQKFGLATGVIGSILQTGLAVSTGGSQQAWQTEIAPLTALAVQTTYNTMKAAGAFGPPAPAPANP